MRTMHFTLPAMLVLTVGLLAKSGLVADRLLAEEPVNSHTQKVTKQVPDAESELESLHGSWVVMRITYEGKEMFKRESKGSIVTSRNDSSWFGMSRLTWIFRNNQFLVESPEGRRGEVFTIKLDPTTKSKSFHVTRVEPTREQSGWMIFARNKDRLRLAFIDALSERPINFEPCSGQVVVDLSRRVNEKTK